MGVVNFLLPVPLAEAIPYGIIGLFVWYSEIVRDNLECVGEIGFLYSAILTSVFPILL